MTTSTKVEIVRKIDRSTLRYVTSGEAAAGYVVQGKEEWSVRIPVIQPGNREVHLLEYVGSGSDPVFALVSSRGPVAVNDPDRRLNIQRRNNLQRLQECPSAGWNYSHLPYTDPVVCPDCGTLSTLERWRDRAREVMDDVGNDEDGCYQEYICDSCHGWLDQKVRVVDENVDDVVKEMGLTVPTG